MPARCGCQRVAGANGVKVPGCQASVCISGAECCGGLSVRLFLVEERSSTRSIG